MRVSKVTSFDALALSLLSVVTAAMTVLVLLSVVNARNPCYCMVLLILLWFRCHFVILVLPSLPSLPS